MGATGPKCEGCALHKIGSGFTQIEIGARYEQTGLLLVGEASGENETREGLPFRPYAQAGSLLADAMRQVNISRSEVAITNVIRCRPPKDWLEGAPYQFAATNHCIGSYLIPAIAELRPRAILALGGTAMRVLTNAPKGRYGTLDYIRGFVQRGAGAAEGIPVIATYHPSFLRRGKPNLTPLLQRDIRRAFMLATGKLVEGQHFSLDPFSLPLRYQTAASIDDAWEWQRNVDPQLPIFFDIETPKSAREDEDERTSDSDRDIRLAQFTQRIGEGIAVPFRDEFADFARSVMALPNLKAGHNSWVFDEEVMGYNGFDITSDTDDTMVMWGATQPDLPKNLQAVSQYCGFLFNWKHLNETDQEFYGVCDVDAVARDYGVLRAMLEREGQWETYVRYFRHFRQVLRAMSKRGLPIDEQRRLDLLKFIEGEDLAKDEQIRALVPREVLTSKQKNGLKRTPKSTEGLRQIEVSILKEEKCSCLKKARPTCVVCLGTGVVPAGSVLTRWAAPVEFNPNSSHQMKAYMKFRKHPVPKHAKRTDAVTGEASETTEVKELEKLFAKTGDKVYSLSIEKRQLSKVKGTYAEGWQPGRDGRIHTTFTYAPATWQTSSRNPNIQNGLKHGSTPFKRVLAEKFNAMQRAESGHVMVNIDAKSFHAQTTACEAGLADYLRLAKIDIHSFVTCHYLRLPKRDYILEMPDEEMVEFFNFYKKDKTTLYNGNTFKFTRDFKAKRTILGIQFAMGPEKLYVLNSDDFENRAEAKSLHRLIMCDLWPGLAKWQDRVCDEAHENGLLRNKFGAVRRFYDVKHWSRPAQKLVRGDQAEAAIAFLPASSAFGYMRDVMLTIHENKWDEEFQLVNSIHDSLVFHCPVAAVERCVEVVTKEVSKPSGVLKYPIAPEGLSVEAEASVGPDLANMSEYKC